MIRVQPIRCLALATFACAPAAVAAQEIAFPGIPWGAPADTVRARLEARGFTFDRRMAGGDDLFRGRDGTWLRADLRGGRAIGFTLLDSAAGEVEARYATLADSLRAARGAPDETGTDQRRPQRWFAGLASVEVFVDRSAGVRQVGIAWLGPGWHDEMAHRAGEAPVPAGYTIVSSTPFVRIAIDTTVGGPRGAQRGRFRIEYRQPITPLVDGVAQPAMDAVEYEMELDCAGGRTRLLARATYLAGRRLSSARPEGQPWTVPQPDGHYARGRDAVCRAARRGRG